MTNVELNCTESARSSVFETVQITRFQSSAEDLALAGSSGLCKDKKNKIVSVSPRDIMPVPEPKRKVTNKGPKPSKAALITSSPYKNALLSAGENRKKSGLAEKKKNLKDKKKKYDPQPTKKTRTKTKQAVKKKHFDYSDDESCHSDFDCGESVLETSIGVEKPGDVDVVCLFCEGLFLADNLGELRAHNDCAGCEKDVYVCDFCK